jgi:adenylate cyclase
VSPYAEIERKFLVEHLPPELEIDSEDEIAQGYLSTGEDQVRLRRRGDRYLITAKRGHGLIRDEVEVPLERDSFEELWPMTEGRRLEKTRRTTQVDEHTAEIDVYKGPLDGLMTVEVEFEDAGAAEAFSPPAWFSRELTSDPRYSNTRLAMTGLPEPEEA